MKSSEMKEDFRHAPSRDPADLEREADASRESIRKTLDSLEHSFSPGQILDRGLRLWRNSESEFATNLSRTVRTNPVPVLLSAIGLAWLGMADRRGPQPAPPHKTGAGAAATARDRLVSVRSRATDAASSASAQGGRAWDGAVRLQEEQPFVVGALALALGAILGGVVPRSQTEDAALGDYAGQVREAAKRKGHQAVGGAVEAVETHGRGESDRPLTGSP